MTHRSVLSCPRRVLVAVVLTVGCAHVDDPETSARGGSPDAPDSGGSEGAGLADDNSATTSERGEVGRDGGIIPTFDDASGTDQGATSSGAASTSPSATTEADEGTTAPDSGGDASSVPGSESVPETEPACVPACGGAVCGEDGCGGSCGSCELPESCGGGGAPGACGSCLVEMCRYFNPSNGDHFYTIACPAELAGYNKETSIGRVEPVQGCLTSDTVPLYRYYSAATSDHFYTASYAELGAGNESYAYEGIEGYLSTIDKPELHTKALHRYYNAGTRHHFYTSNWAELGAGNDAFAYEGVAGYVFGD